MKSNKMYRVHSCFEKRDIELKTDAFCNRDDIEIKNLLWGYIFKLSDDCDIKLSSALRIASQYPHVLDEINQYLRLGYVYMPISLFLVCDDDKQYVPCEAIKSFIIGYNRIFECTGLYIDEDQGDAYYLWENLWEVERRLVDDKLPSRLYAKKFLKSKNEADDFLKRYEPGTLISEVEMIEGNYGEFDMEWITNVPIDATFGVAREYANNYWNKKLTEKPIIEVVFIGVYKLKEPTDM